MEIKNSSDQKAELYFYGDIVSNTWRKDDFQEDKCPQDIVDFLNEIGSNKDIDIYVNSGGGSVDGGLAIYNILKRHKGYKTAYVDGIAASIATVILFACDEIRMPKNAQMMIHNPWSVVFAGNAEDFRSEAKALDISQKSILQIYMDHVKEGVTEAELIEMMSRETWFTGEQAAQYFDIKIEGASEIVACSSSYFKEYKNPPENLKSFKVNMEISRQELSTQSQEGRKNKILCDLDYI